MKKHNPPLIRIVFSLAVLVGAVLLPVFAPQRAFAAQIVDRSLTLMAGGGGDGGSMPGGTVNHLFSFTLPAAGTPNVQSILFQYCTLAGGVTDPCTTPTGLDTTSITLGAETGAAGFSVDDTTNGLPFLTRNAATISPNTAVTYRLDGVVNPSNTNETFFVRISTYNSDDATGSPIDTGTVAASTATQIEIDGTMPESLVFCTGATIGLTGGVPDCATATAGSITFDRLFSPIDTATTTSQMAASTNAGAGYAITVNGPTLTSGSNSITGMGTSTTGIRGTSQFGLNLKANTTATSTPAVGTEVDPAANGTNYRGQAVTGYNTADNFKFTTGDIVADSANGGPGGTDAQIFTVAYIVNVPGSQPAGTYTTTLTYICTPEF